MPLEAAILHFWLPAWLLVVARMSGVILTVPMVANADIPAFIKVVLVITLAAMVFPVVVGSLPVNINMPAAVAGLAGELIIGELIGLATGAVFWAAQLAGHLTAQQSGLALGSVIDPFFETETTALEQAWFFIAAMIFFALRGHLAFIHGLLDSFRAVPPLQFFATDACATHAAAMLSLMFELGLRLAGPAILGLLLATVALGFLTRTMPQFNMLSVGFAVKVLLALAITVVAVGISDDPISTALTDGLDSVGRLFESMAAAIARS